MSQLKYDNINNQVADELLDRFLRYVRIFTTSDETVALEKTPSTECQWELIRLLESELKQIGVTDLDVDDYGYLIARIPGNLPAGRVETIGLMAHVDTSGDAPGNNVQPVVHQPYEGGIIKLKGISINPQEFPLLNRYVGRTVITSDGTTLLGADNKAGIAEIMTAIHWLLNHPEVKRGDIEVIITPDEETGCGMNRFPIERLKSAYCFTIDGGEEGELETECCNAWKAEIEFSGRVIHPGSARGKLVNAITMAAAFVGMLPRNESPEATDGRYGYYWPHKIEGNLERASLQVYYRSFDMEDIQRRTAALKSFAAAVEAAFPGGEAALRAVEQYRNMREELAKHPKLVDCLRNAVRASGVEPIEHPIRGGTDGSRLTAMGIPTPNVFAGGVSFHSRSEWVALPAMTRAVTVILNLIGAWAEGK